MVVVAALGATLAADSMVSFAPARLEGRAGTPSPRQQPNTIEAAFRLESYVPRSTATLKLWTSVSNLRLQVFRVGPEPSRTVGSNEMRGVPMTRPRRIAAVRAGATLGVAVGEWPSGLYFARLNAGDRVGYAPFVVPPRRLGEHRVAVVLPTRTWMAYNHRDDDRDGIGDTWYADQRNATVQMWRPFLNRGVPPYFRRYDVHFLHWLHRTGKRVDVLSQTELDRASARALRRAYELLVFPGHHEYVTTREYDAVQGFRDLGGNLVFLSANNFFWRIDVANGRMTRVEQWRDLGRPEAALIGVQYIGNDNGEHRGPWIVRDTKASSWLFEGVRLGPRHEFSNAGIEIDALAPSSPRGTEIVATIPNLLGHGMTAHMSYYELRNGAKVFAAGAFTLAGSIRQPTVQRLLENVWRRLAEQPPAVRRTLSVRTGYGWPVKPFDEQHPVRGFFGDPRIGMTPKGMNSSFHFGVDVVARNGTPVFATLSGTVIRWAHRPETVGVRGDDGRTQFEYWHVVPAVGAGQRVTAYVTVVGRIAAPWAHVHFSEAHYGRYVNPLRPGAMKPFADHTRPVVRSLAAEAYGRPVPGSRLHGRVDLVVEAFDVAPVAVPAPWNDKPVTPAVVRWRITGGPDRPLTTAVDFRRVIPPDAQYGSVYARWTRQNKRLRVGRYRFYLVRSWNTRALRDGVHTVEVVASDTAGNRAATRFTVIVRN